jgi:outer membrane lipoprotein-sorting protein
MRARSTRLIIAVLFLGWAQAAAAQTADEVIEKHLAAIGGRAALGKLTSRSMTGTFTVSTPVGELSGPIEIVNAAPNKARTVIKLDVSAVGGPGEMVIEQRFDGTVGYAMDSMQGNRDITGGQLDNMRNSTFPTPLLNYKASGATVELGGKEKVGTRDAFVLVFTPKTGPTNRLFFDAETFMAVRMMVKVEVPQMGELEQTSDFSDIRDVDGVKVPFSVKSSSSAQSFTIAITTVAHNTKVDEAQFSKPK